MVKKIVRSASVEIPKDIDGCHLVAITEGKKHFPKVQDNVLPNTYYRIQDDKPEYLRALVTVMPDGLRAAWDNCGKCMKHVSGCICLSGVYPPRVIGWMRATYDINYPTEKVSDYSKYNDPYKKLVGAKMDAWTEGIRTKPTESDKPQPVKRKSVDNFAQVKSNSPDLTVSDIQNLDLEKLSKEANKQAKRTIRRARSIIKGVK